MARLNARRTMDWDTPFDEIIAEPALARRRRIDAAAKDGKRGVEIDRTGCVIHMERAAKRLKAANVADRVLRVPQWDMPKAVEAMKRAGVNGRVTNLCESKFRRARPKRAFALED